MFGAPRATWEIPWNARVVACPVCGFRLAPPYSCVIVRGCLFDLWESTHWHTFCSVCNAQIITYPNGEICYAPYHSVASKHR